MNCFYLLTFGCQMNKNDSERIAGLLSSLGLKATDKAEEADVIVANTCSVRQTAEDRVYGHVRNWQELRKKKPNLIIVVTGCMPGRDKDGNIRKKLRGVDLFFPIDELPSLPERLKGLDYWLFCHSCVNLPVLSVVQAGGEPDRGDWSPNQAGDDKNGDYLSITPLRSNKFQAFITIQTGCNNYCAYCVVPHARGRGKNRPVKEILQEIKEFVQQGGKKVTLLGQVVNDYKAPDTESFDEANPFRDNFAALLWEINQMEGLERVHFTAPGSQYFSNEQIQALTLPKQVNYLHLPVQSGDNEILRKMNRKYAREQYMDLIKNIRAAKSDIAIGTDLIVGFPGETEEQFQNTLDLYRQCDFDISYPAMYSERSGTSAARAFKDDVPRAEKKRRWEAVQELMEEITFKKNQSYKGKEAAVLVEYCEDGICSGYSREMKLVQFLGAPDLVGQIINVTITQPELWALKGVI